MGEKRLLDRVRSWGKHDPGRTGNDIGRKIESVILHLQKLLNARQGTTLMDTGFGMPDFTDLTALFPDSVRDIERSISKTIETYEPRLSEVNVDFVFQDDQSLSLLFQIQALLKSENGDIDVHLESAIDTGGKMVIKG